MPDQTNKTDPLPVRIGAVNYLNSKPLVYRLQELQPAARVLFDLPSRLADSLAAGRLDVALIPVVEYFANPDYKIASDACVASNGPVRSVKLYFRCPPASVRRIALDEGSRTSSALARVLLNERFGLQPEVAPLPIGSDTNAVDADAVLLIGDRAMMPPAEKFVEEWDLATEWRRWTGLPFVFACWVARSTVAEDESQWSHITAALATARDEGVRSIEQIASCEAPKLGLNQQLAEDYLHQNLHFHLGPPQQKSLQRFRAECERLGLLDAATMA